MDESRYAALLAEHRPRIIETAEEHDRLLSLAEELMEKGESLQPEEEQLLALVVLLIEAFEASFEGEEEAELDEEAEIAPVPMSAASGNPTPVETLQRLLQSGGFEASDIADIFGSPHLTRKVLDGHQPISRNQAKLLAKFFQVPDKLFRENGT